MTDTAIKVTNLSKLYQIGTQRSGSLRDTLSGKWQQLTGRKETSATQDFLALQDVSFEIMRGEAVGIIGKNGAGKSTLLKILSRITQPTKGRIEINGRVASLLEVGTGFHPELSGRENIFLNGTILGMTRKEIKNRFDDIVDFSGISKFIDMPVKRYSSGMYVRLAFAVAAHLESEILILDEVLAVGDAEFQKKCLGKMNDVAHKQGRTVIFVSHNMTAIKSLCNKGIYLAAGHIAEIGSIESVSKLYLEKSIELSNEKKWVDPDFAPGNDQVRLKSARIINEFDTTLITLHTPLSIEFEFWNFVENALLNFSVVLYTNNDECVLNTVSPKMRYSSGIVKGNFYIPPDFLNDTTYRIRLLIVREGKVIFEDTDILSFEVVEEKREGIWYGKWVGVVRPKFKWELVHNSEYKINA